MFPSHVLLNLETVSIGVAAAKKRYRQLRFMYPLLLLLSISLVYA